MGRNPQIRIKLGDIHFGGAFEGSGLGARARALTQTLVELAKVHEFSVTTQIVENVLREAEKHSAKKVVEVHLIIGKLTFLGVEQVRFSYNLLVKGTIMEGSKLQIEEKNGVVKCSSCGYEGDFMYDDDLMYHVSTPTLRCPKCGGTVDIVGGRECTIKRIKFVM